MAMNPTIFLQVCKQNGLPVPIPEFRFHPTRKWRFDYAFVDQKVALEIEGAIWTGGRHTRGKGFASDMEKYNAAAVLGWIVLRCQPKDLMKLETVTMVKQAIATRTAA